ncbi:MAG TPA: VWA domain-containing protein [Phycisphaerae bacterium]|nr:VWA domain-containing protein [Phycisphaerae bacterium]
MSGTRPRHRSTRRRGIVAVKVALLSIVLLGFTALAVDMGAIYDAKAELQRTADAAALAAGTALAATGETPAMQLATARASEYAANNTVWRQQMQLDPATDITFGRATFNSATGVYDFTPTTDLPDAVQVRVRKTADSPNGAFGLYFASVLGIDRVDLTATATAMMVPRDIAIVTDLSNSHNDDSELKNYQSTQINLHGVWDAFPGGIDDSPSQWADYPQYSPNDPQAAGPAWGYMKEMGYGANPIDGGYDPTLDDGLVYLPSATNWNNASLDAYLGGFADLGYNVHERDVVRSKYGGSWKYRVAVALGLARWDSGIIYGDEVPQDEHGLWERLSVPPEESGDGDLRVDADELVWQERIGNRSLEESKAIWLDYIQAYMSTSPPPSEMETANSDFLYRFGVKTFMNYLMEERASHAQTPEFAEAPAQPMQAVKESVQHLVELLDNLGVNDQVSLEVYGTTAVHEMDLTQDFLSIGARLNAMQAGYYDNWTNMGGGIVRAIEELTGERSRSAARKVIFLLTDGYANVSADGTTGNLAGGRAYALQEVDTAVGLGIRIFTVSVGSYSDTQLMAQIAETGAGQHFHAEGSIDQYSDQLEAIFEALSGRRTVELIQ